MNLSETDTAASLPTLELQLPAISAGLQPLLAATRVALEGKRLVVVVGLWHPIRAAALLPLHVYFGWEGLQQLLPLHPQLGLVCFRPADLRVLELPLYNTTATLDVRRMERVRRADPTARTEEVLAPSDWEQGLNRRPGRFRNLVLPASSFLQISSWTGAAFARRRRPVLGRVARGGPEPSCLVHGRGEIGVEERELLSAVDVLLVDIQGLRGMSRFESVARLLARRSPERPTVLVASAPSDLVSLAEIGTLDRAVFYAVGPPLSLANTEIRLVGKDRLEAEREFEFAFGDLNQDDPTDARLLSLAKSAWWASRQRFASVGQETELRKFDVAFAALESENPSKASSLRLARELLDRHAKDEHLETERRREIIDATLSAPGAGGVLVLTRNWQAADALRIELAKLGWSAEELRTMGVSIHPSSLFLQEGVDCVVATGFFGSATLDNAVGARGRSVCLVVDPIEARAAWFALRALIAVLERIGASDSQPALMALQQAIGRYVPAFASDVAIDWRFDAVAGRVESTNHLTDPVETGYVAIIFTDGTRLDVHENSRFEVLNASALGLKTVSARELNRGDEIILLADSHTLFSDRLLNILDTGQLASAADVRKTWLGLVRAVFEERGLRVADVARAMQQDGFDVRPFNVRCWLDRDLGNALVPDRVDKFLSFARALGVSLQEDLLKEFFGEISRLRHAHRRCGRYLARAIRGAYSGRLDAPNLARIERDWGLSYRQLMEAAELVTVEEVLRSGPDDAAH